MRELLNPTTTRAERTTLIALLKGCHASPHADSAASSQATTAQAQQEECCEQKRDLAAFYAQATVEDEETYPKEPHVFTAAETIRAAAEGVLMSDPLRFHSFLIGQASHNKRPAPTVITDLLPHINMQLCSRGGSPDSDQSIYFLPAMVDSCANEPWPQILAPGYCPPLPPACPQNHQLHGITIPLNPFQWCIFGNREHVHNG